PTMTPRTRSSNNDASHKVYRSRKITRQAFFPHKRKVARRRSTQVPDESGKRQMVFLPEIMRAQGMDVVMDSDEDGDEEDMESEIKDERIATSLAPCKEPSLTDTTKRSDRERRRSTIEKNNKENDNFVGPAPKRKRNVEDNRDRSHALRRQSTMTQLVHGRRPLSIIEKPNTQLVKSSPRLNWSGRGSKKGNGKQQRTLTQMIPSMRPPEVVSDDDVADSLSDREKQDRENQEYGGAVLQRLAQQGLHKFENVVFDAATAEHIEHDLQSLPEYGHYGKEQSPRFPAATSHVLQSIEGLAGEDNRNIYQPTQFIDAPTKRARRVSRRQPKIHQKLGSIIPPQAQSLKAYKYKFTMLSTPERRNIREIPSSQSPADSPLSTQASPQKVCRSPSKECSGGVINTLETPLTSKQVAFQELTDVYNIPPTLKRFHSTIQDSEDEDGTMIEEDVPSSHHEMYHRLGEQPKDAKEIQNAGAPEQYLGQTTCTTHTQEAPQDVKTFDVVAADLTLSHQGKPGALFEPVSDQVASSVPIEELHRTSSFVDLYPQDTFPSTPMAIGDVSSSEEAYLDSTPPSESRPMGLLPASTNIQPFLDADGETAQVSHSPLIQHETQVSYSSKAEQQLQKEWLSYSQYNNACPPQSSSMNALQDTFSYNATPNYPHPVAPQALPRPSGYHPNPSQATTVDEVTPRKDRVQRTTSAHVTPDGAAHPQLSFTSPTRPPPLVLPSSFLSPAISSLESWSSLTYSRTQDDLRSSQFLASLEDFSIPLPPPAADDLEM
ncbi:hypothetical protein BKA66DRAFT_417829, partial [Pyrenochaeta sp. MPI-SDFR-AT-0127]